MTSTPYGKIVESLLDEGAQLGVSSRGMGTLKQDKNGTNVVQDDFYLATAADIVADPSAPKAFVEGIMEGREWVWESGILKEKEIELLKNELDKKKSIREELVLSAFESFISKL